MRTWRGFPADPETETSGVGWILAVDWVPYQRSTFVTPAFPGYVSGHSTFSRAAAEVMAAFTGDTYFPGGLSEYTLPRERAAPRGGADRRTPRCSGRPTSTPPTRPACRGIYMGIHITEDDFNGRRIGSACGLEAWALAQRYFDGTARVRTISRGLLLSSTIPELRGSTADRVLKRGRKLACTFVDLRRSR